MIANDDLEIWKVKQSLPKQKSKNLLQCKYVVKNTYFILLRKYIMASRKDRHFLNELMLD